MFYISTPSFSEKWKKERIADQYFHRLVFHCVKERLVNVTWVNSYVSLGGSCLIAIQFVLLLKKVLRFYVFFQSTVLCLHFYRYLSRLLLTKRVTLQVFIWLMHRFYFLFFPLSFKKPLKNLKRMQGELRILPRVMHVEFYPIGCMKLHWTPWLVIFFLWIFSKCWCALNFRIVKFQTNCYSL